MTPRGHARDKRKKDSRHHTTAVGWQLCRKDFRKQNRGKDIDALRSDCPLNLIEGLCFASARPVHSPSGFYVGWMNDCQTFKAVKVANVDCEQLSDTVNIHARREPGVMNTNPFDFIFHE